MRDPTQLINNRWFRGLVKRLGFSAARRLIRGVFLPVMLPPPKRRMLRGRIQRYLKIYFPELSEEERRARAMAFVRNWGNKFAEDCITLSVGRADHFARIIDRHVQYENPDNLRKALSHSTGTVAVGCHVGSPTFGTCALMGLLRSVEKVPPIRICVEPETERFPTVLGLIEEVLEDYGWDVGLLLPRRDYQTMGGQMIDLLERGAIITTNLDVLVGGSSRVTFPMFDRARVYLPALVGAAWIALRTGATVLPWVNLRTQDGFRLVIEEPLGPVPCLGSDLTDDHPELLALCERLRSQLESWIRAQPEQWVYWDRWHLRVAESA